MLVDQSSLCMPWNIMSCHVGGFQYILYLIHTYNVKLHEIGEREKWANGRTPILKRKYYEKISAATAFLK